MMDILAGIVVGVMVLANVVSVLPESLGRRAGHDEW